MTLVTIQSGNPHASIPLVAAVTLTWDLPKGNGPWLVVERGGESGYSDGSRYVTRSDSGVVRRRARSERAAELGAMGLRGKAWTRGWYTTIYDVVHVDSVSCSDSSQPYGCNAMEG